MTNESDPKNIVRAGYDACGPRYNLSRNRDSCVELDLLADALPPDARVLDIGCGGRPVAGAFADRASITGIDISSVQVAAARTALPEGRFIAGDIATQEFVDSSFDAVIAFYTLIHLPRDEHEPLLERITRWLRPGGYLLLTVGRTDTPSCTEPDFFGVTMFWSHFPADWYAAALQRLDYDVVSRGVVGTLPDQHPVFLARRHTRIAPSNRR